jgi:hypothetical protein
VRFILAEGTDREEFIRAKVVVSGHGPTARRHTDRFCRIPSRIGGMTPVQMPNQAEFEKTLADG